MTSSRQADELDRLQDAGSAGAELYLRLAGRQGHRRAGGRRGARSVGVKVKWWEALVDGVAPGQLGSESNGGAPWWTAWRQVSWGHGQMVGALVDGVAPGQSRSRSNSGSSLWPSQITKLWKAEVVGLALTMLHLQLCQYLRTVGCIKMDRRGTLSCIYFDREVVHPFIYFMFWLLAELFAYDSHY